ncbi:ATP-binding protein [Aquincola tertiaricarbonis]|uniref:ATP-binding protein n=1 Tax=Aquincola tertiaricarbonis TaxID=391953 RepID=A0ABY4SF15_AQUTE|nr:AAA family ATPase [Aquincola tertiaricarbonis]URI11064.1 ATP-binding protein [Aquincola tertiaricarbonis]
MPSIFPAKNPYSPFPLPSEHKWDTGVLAITGKNGAGKSRLLKAIADNSVEISVESVGVVRSQNIVHLTQANMHAQIEATSGHSVDFGDVLNECASYYDRNKSSVVWGQMQQHGRTVTETGLDINAVRTAVLKAAERRRCDTGDLTGQDVADEYTNISPQPFGYFRLQNIFSEYLARMNRDHYHEFLNYKGVGDAIHHGVNFPSRFGPPPWIEFNELLERVFNGKFSLRLPTTLEKNYKPQLLLSGNGIPIASEQLSSGEQTLLWLTTAIFSATRTNLSASASVILLDEPDAFLHPAMVRQFDHAIHQIAKTLGAVVVLTTHSPTTVALMTNCSFAQLADGALREVSRDQAVDDLLAGITSIAIDLQNRRHVFVESHYDAAVYQQVHEILKDKDDSGLTGISFNFTPAASKVPVDHLKSCLTKHLGKLPGANVESFIEAVNGAGSCDQVSASVEALSPHHDANVWGVIDWDRTNRSSSRVLVHGESQFYSLENAVLNPVALGAYLTVYFPAKITSEPALAPLRQYIGERIHTEKPAQLLSDAMTEWLLDDNSNPMPFKLAGERTVTIPQAWLHTQGHALNDKILNKLPQLRSIRPGPLMLDVAKRGFRLFPWTIPASFETLFHSIASSRSN